MAKQKGEITDTVRRIVRFLEAKYGAYNISLDAVTIEFTVKRGNINEVWQNQNAGRIHTYLDDVRVTTIMLDHEPDRGEQRELDNLLFKYITEEVE